MNNSLQVKDLVSRYVDEPTLRLAHGMAKQIFQIIPNLVDLGLTILIAEQDVRHTLQCADYG